MNEDTLRTSLLQELLPHCPDVQETVVQDFLTRMDKDYFDRFSLSDIATHICLVNQLEPDNPCHITFGSKTDRTFDLIIIAYDYFSEFSIICGLLSAFRLDIREGHLYTFSDAEQALSLIHI